ncbi:NAD(P)-dependent oxidoreductase [Saccharothrix sp. AJ9571]|nr:NAD(P)-dependent oxidoreductase [Saccharothrix sp. AJ9571]
MGGAVGGLGGKPVLLTGATGFIGSAVVRELRRVGWFDWGPPLVVLSRSPPDWLAGSGVEVVKGDLAEPSGLRGIADGISTVIHIAAQIGGDAERCRRVNHDGTRFLLEEAEKAGIRRFLYMSTTAVYGHGPHRGISESLLAPEPVSATSLSRAHAEREVRKFGGTVLRPHLVYGPGDTWFVPGLCRLVQAVPAWIDGGAARTSVIDVDDLAALVVRLMGLSWGKSRGAVFHANHPRPVTVREVVSTVCRELGLRVPVRNLSAEAHRARTRKVLPGLTDHQFDLLARDHWYDSERLWRRTDADPGGGFAEKFARSAGWYRTHISPDATEPVDIGVSET